MDQEDKKYLTTLFEQQTKSFEKKLDETKVEIRSEMQDMQKGLQGEMQGMRTEIIHEVEHHTGALAAYFQSGLSAVAEQYLSLNTKVDTLGNKVDTLDHKVDALDTKVNVLESKVDVLDAKVSVVESKVDILEEKADETLDILRANQETLIEHDRAIKEIQHAKR